MVIEREPFALCIRCVGTANIRPFIPVEAEPAQIVQHAFGGPTTYTGTVEVFDAQYELTICATCVEPGKQSGAQVAQVQVARRAGSIATAKAYLSPRQGSARVHPGAEAVECRFIEHVSPIPLHSTPAPTVCSAYIRHLSDHGHPALSLCCTTGHT